MTVGEHRSSPPFGPQAGGGAGVPQVQAVPGDGRLPQGAASWAAPNFYASDGSVHTKPRGIQVPVDGFSKQTHAHMVCPKAAARGCEPRWVPIGQVKSPPLCLRCSVPFVAARPVSWLSQVLPWRDVVVMLREQAPPLYALGAIAAAGVVVDATQVAPWLLAGAAPAGFEVGRRGVKWWRGRKPDTLAEAVARQAREVGWCTAAGCLSGAVFAGFGAGSPVSWTALLLAWLPAAGTWWKRRRDERNAPPAPPPVTEQTAVTEVAPVDFDEQQTIQYWNRYVAARPNTQTGQRGGKLAGTSLEGWRRVEGGWGATICSERGQYTGEAFIAAQGAIASAYRMKRSMITVIPDPEDETQALVLAQRSSPIRETVHWAGPQSIDVVRGVAPVAAYADGDPVWYEMYRPGWGVPHVAAFGTTGSGKALALDTPIPTPTGWTTMGELRRGDQVFDEHGQICNVVAATDVMHGRPCYEVEFSDGTVIVADAQHQWKTSTQRGRWQRNNLARHTSPKRDRSALRVMLDTAPVTTEQIAATLYAVRGGTQPAAVNHAIDVCGPLDYPKQDLPIAPYTLGAWLGDGSTNYAAITTPDREVLDRIRQDGYTVRKWSAPLAYGISTNPYEVGDARRSGIKSMPALLREVGALGNKHVPEVYLRSSIEQRQELLAGLLDTDGTCGKTGEVVLALTCRSLAMDALDLIQGLGYKATMTTKRVKGRREETSTCYSISFTPNDIVFHLPRKAARQRPVKDTYTSRRRYITAVRPVLSVPVKCIQVDSPSRLYLASAACIPTHNSELMNQLFAIDRWAHYIDEHGQAHGIVANFLIDPQQGQSFAPFIDDLAAPPACSLPEAMLLMEALHEEMLRRNRYLAKLEYRDERGRKRKGRKWWNPLVDGPILSVTIDEAHDYLSHKPFTTLATKAGRMWRKCGGQVRLATHTPLLSDLGGSMALRDMLTGGFVWVGRTANSLSGPTAFNGRLPADPRTVPAIPGTAYILTPSQPKAMLARTAWVEDYYDWVRNDADEPIGYPAVLPPETLAAFGSDFTKWCDLTRMGFDFSSLQREQVTVSPGPDVKSVGAVRAFLAQTTAPLTVPQIDEGMQAAGIAQANGKPFTTRTVRDAVAKLKTLGEVEEGPGKTYTLVAAREEAEAAHAELGALELVELAEAER